MAVPKSKVTRAKRGMRRSHDALVAANPLLMAVARWGGALFLVVYGAGAARRALVARRLTAGAGETLTRRGAVLAALAFTYLNPHCWLDTVVLLGSIASQQPPPARLWFGVGATSASVAWFFALGYGARLLRPVFARPLAWKVLDAAITLVMWGIAATLLR